MVGAWTSDDIDLMLKIIDKILKAKEIRVKLKKEVSLDMSTVSSFIDQIFKVIISSASKATADKVMAEIVKEVIIPFKTQGRIVGKDFEYDPQANTLFTAMPSTGSIKVEKRKTRRKSNRASGPHARKKARQKIDGDGSK